MASFCFMLMLGSIAMAAETPPTDPVNVILKIVPVLTALFGVLGVYFFRKKASEKELAEIHKIYSDSKILEQEGTSRTYRELFLAQKTMIDDQADAIKCMQERLDGLATAIKNLQKDNDLLWEQNRQCKEENILLKQELEDLKQQIGAQPAALHLVEEKGASAPTKQL